MTANTAVNVDHATLPGGLFLPLEVVKREYLGRLCLAVEMAGRGVPVFIGHKKWVIRLALEAPEAGVFFYKDAAQDEWFVPGLRERGFALVAQDEEAGIIYNDFEDFYRRRRTLDNIPELDLFFAWGRADFRYLDSRFGDSGRRSNIVDTGAVKTILWGPLGYDYFAEEIGSIRRRYGRFVIFITNFAVGNSYLPASDLISLGRKNAGNIDELYRERYEREKRLVRFTLDAASAIVEQTGLNVVIRPHPTEDVAFWERETRFSRGIAVEAEGDLSPWILASAGVLHNSCTSGIQSAASDVPVIAFGETPADLEGECSVPNRVSIPAVGIESVVSTVDDIERRWSDARSGCRAVLYEKLTGVGNREPLTRTAEALLTLIGKPCPGGNRVLGRDSLVYDLREIYRMSSLRRPTRRTVLDQRKRPTITETQVKRDVERVCRLLDCPRDLLVRRVAPNTYCIRDATV